jgi:hypothetical protein
VHPSHSMAGGGAGRPATPYQIFLRVLGLATIVMTIPQAWSVWTEGPQGVSVITWSGYLASAVAWLVYGIRKRDMTIWLECIGWIVLDVAIIAGTLMRR